MVRQFSDLTDEEKQELRKKALERAKKERRDLLEGVECVYRPIVDCKCNACVNFFKGK